MIVSRDCITKHWKEINIHIASEKRTDNEYTGWAKSRIRVIIFFFTGIVNDGRETTKQLSITMLNNLT